MKQLKFAAVALALVAITGCSTFDRYAANDNSTAMRSYAPSQMSAANPVPGAGAPGGEGAGAVVRR